MRMLFLAIIVLASVKGAYSQISSEKNAGINLRASILLFPTTPLLTLEVKTIGNVTLQFESNFQSTHGINIKYFFNEPMHEAYVFSGIAFVENELLRADGEATLIPYLGYGYAYRFGTYKNWTIDSRIGIGPSLNADTNGIYPILKAGIGRIF